MEKVQKVESTPLGKNTGLTFDPNTGESITVGELKRRQNAKKNKNNAMANNGPPPENASHPEENVVNATLPQGWKKTRLEKNPKVEWYTSDATGEEQWYAPGAPESFPVVLEDESGLESGWKKAYNSRNNAEPKAVWYEHENGRTQWNRPTAVAPTPASTPIVNTVGSNKNALGNLKAQINKLGNTLNQMHSTLTKTQAGGRKKRRTTRRRKTRRKYHSKK